MSRSATEDPERTLLIGAPHSDDEDEPKPLPWRPIIVLLLLSIAQPLAYELVFPFINQMLVELHVVDDPERVGFYSGLIESIFAVTSLITILPTSYAADRYGRKPVMLGGITGLGISLVFFGTSRTFVGLVISRCIGGGMGGVWIAVKVMLGELTDKSNQDAAFSGITIAYRLGQIIGLPIGGFLAHPERHWPNAFDSEFWRTYPYALPCFVGAGFAFFAVFCGILFVKETLPPKHPERKVSVHADESGNMIPESYTPDETTTPQPQTKTVSYRSVMTKDIVALLISNLAMCLASETLFTVYPLFAFTPIESGGLSFTESQIGGYLAIRAIIQLIMMAFVPELLRNHYVGRGSVVRLYQVSMFVWPITVACYPFLNLLARKKEMGLLSGWVFDSWMMAFFVVWGFGGYCWTTIGLTTNNASPSADALATVNGILQMTINLPQAIAPAFATSTFAVSVDHQILGGNLHWVIFFVLTFAGAVHSLVLKEPTHDWREEAATAASTARKARASASASQ